METEPSHEQRTHYPRRLRNRTRISVQPIGGSLRSARRYGYAAATTLFAILFLLYPYLEHTSVGEDCLDLLSSLLIVFLSVALLQGRRTHPLHFIVPSILLFIVWTDTYFEGPFIQMGQQAILASLCLGTSFRIVLDLFRRHEVSLNQLAGCAAAYFTVGFAFASMYCIVDILHPHAFTPMFEVGFRYSDALMFSFTNLTTVSFGDVMPAEHFVRSLGLLEAVGGQLFLSIFVGQTVGTFISYKSQHRRS